MHEKEKLNALAYSGKLIVANLDWNQENKNHASGIIDITAEALKLAVSVKDVVFERFQAAARLHDLDRLIVFPCIIKEKIQFCYRMVGGNIPAFCMYTGIRLLTGTENYLNPSHISQMEQQYGVVLYERK